MANPKKPNARETIADFFLLPVGFLWYGYALSVLWGWFLVPLGLPAVSVLHAAGIDFLVCFVLTQLPTRSEFGEVIEWGRKSYGFRLLVRAVMPAYVLGVGWCIHWGMS